MIPQDNEKKSDFRDWLLDVRSRLSLLHLIGALVVFPFIIYQIYHLARDMVYGDGSVNNMIVTPRYEVLRVPESPTTIQYGGVGRLAGDFAQVYFPSKDLLHLENAYSAATTLDPWLRASRYAPFLSFFCALTICQFPFGYAGFVHVVLQFVLFLAGFGFAFQELKITKYLVPSVFLLVTCISLTPAGLSWFERGQFSLYVALSYLWLFLGLLKEKKLYIVFSALFAFIKWTSFPFLFIFFCVYFLTAKDLKDFRRKIGLFVVFALVIEFLFLFFAKASVLFLLVLVAQEMYSPLFGVSLAKLLPRDVVKIMPLVLIFVGYLNVRKGDKTLLGLSPFFAGAGIILLTFSLIPFEYNILSVFGLAPFVIYWGMTSANNKFLGFILIYTFFGFVIGGSLSLEIFHLEINTIFFYIFMSLICFSIPYWDRVLAKKKQPTH